MALHTRRVSKRPAASVSGWRTSMQSSWMVLSVMSAKAETGGVAAVALAAVLLLWFRMPETNPSNRNDAMFG